MIKGFPIDFIRQALEQKLLEQHIKNVNLFGGKNQVNILSFYEQLKSQDEVDRFVETYRDLTEQQNRTGLILNGVLVSPENPTITNLYSSLIIPMSFTCSLRCMLENRDQSLETINNLIEQLKGRKVDIAQLKCKDENGKTYFTPFMVGTIGQGIGEPTLKNGDYIGQVNALGTINVEDILTNLASEGVYDINKMFEEGQWYYVQYNGKLIVFYCDGDNYIHIEDDGTHNDIIFPPEHESFEKYKLSFSFEALRCDEPRNLNGKEYCELSFGGSCTLVNETTMLGNDLIKIGIKRDKIIKSNGTNTFDDVLEYLEPLEMPSGNNANTQINQLVSNNFKTNTHTDAIALTLQYTFIADIKSNLINKLFDYARYGDQSYITPNIIYLVNEIWSYWGNYNKKTISTKIVENIEIENTESDSLTLSVNMQIQGENH